LTRVVALIPDLLFGSRVQADLRAAGHDIELVGAADAAHDRLTGAEVLVVDLTQDDLDGSRLVEEVSSGCSEAAARPRTLGFYSHVDTATRKRAEEAGFDLVVPRSRMARECAALVTRLAGE
jgi:DNA-binding NarL/FixJ family response regulator